MKLDATKMADWQIAEAAEKEAKSIEQIAEGLGLKKDELIPMGRGLAKVDYLRALERHGNNPTAKYVDVTAITPTPLGDTGYTLRTGRSAPGRPCCLPIPPKPLQPPPRPRLW